MTAAVMAAPLEHRTYADAALTNAARFWFVVAVAGQWLFAFYIASYYGGPVLHGNPEAWNRTLAHGWVPGNTIGNTAVAAHLFFAAALSLAGALQLVPRIRARFPAFHRWNGRIYLAFAFLQGIAALYLNLSGRRVVGDRLHQVAFDIDAALIIVFAVLAYRYARARDFATHRRWVLRLFMVVSSAWFFRVGLMLWLAINKGPVGFDPSDFSGPFLTFLAFAQYLVPLALLEIYLRTRSSGRPIARYAVAGGLVALTLATVAGEAGAAMSMWLPKIEAAYDSRTSIADTLATVIASDGIETAVQRYHQLRAAAPPNYNFDESELNGLGYQLLRVNKFKPAIRILQLNVEAYPQSSNVYDSLGEAYMNDGDRADAITNYRKSLELNPNNANAVQMLRKIEAAAQPSG